MDFKMNRLFAIAAISSSIAIGTFQQAAVNAFPFNPKDSYCQWIKKDGTNAGTLYKCQVEYDSSGLIIYMKWKDGEASAIGRTGGWGRVGKNCFHRVMESNLYRICYVEA